MLLLPGGEGEESTSLPAATCRLLRGNAWLAGPLTPVPPQQHVAEPSSFPALLLQIQFPSTEHLALQSSEYFLLSLSALN